MFGFGRKVLAAAVATALVGAVAVILIGAVEGAARGAPPQRIISLAPSNTEILFALGLADKVVGVTNACDYPPEAASKPRVGDINLNYERILELAPDLIVAVESMQKPAIDRLRSLGLNVLSVDARDLEGVFKSIEVIGEACGKAQEAHTLADSLRQRTHRAREAAARELAAAGGDKARPRVFVEIWNEPLMTIGPDTFYDEIVTAAGGQNVAYDARQPWPQVSAEMVISRDPQVVVLIWKNKAEFLGRAAWRKMSAVVNGRVYEVNPDIFSRPGPRIVEGLEQMVKLLWPAVRL